MYQRIGFVFALLVLVCFVSAAYAADSTVLRVVVVKTDNVSAYVQEIEKGKAMLKKMESPAVIRVWKARFAGPETGMVVVSVEYPSLTALANDDAKVAANAEYMAWLTGLDKLRTIVSDSLYTEQKP